MLKQLVGQLSELSLEELNKLNRAVVDRMKTVQASEAASAALSLKVGDRGLLQRVRGKWAGQAVLVQAIRGSKAVVETIQDSRSECPQLCDIDGTACAATVPANCIRVFQ